MRKRNVSLDEERELLIGLILSKEFLQDMKPIVQLELFQNPYARTVAKWCLDYYDRYDDAPKSEIQTIFESEKRRLSDTDIEYMEKMFVILNQLSGKVDVVNFKYRADNAEIYLKRRKIELFVEKLESNLEADDIASAENQVAKFVRLERPKGQGVDVLNDDDRVGRALAPEYRESMFSVFGDLGDLLGSFNRGDLVAVAGPPKRGKSWWLLQFAQWALEDGLKVLFVSLEMLEDQCIRRVAQMFTATPISARSIKELKFVEVEKDQFFVVEKEEQRNDVVSRNKWELAKKTFRRLCPVSQFRLLTFPQDTLNVEDLEIHLENLEYFEQFIPDVVIVDYADIMAPERNSPRGDYRNRLDQTWKSLRSLAQKRNILVMTGSQTSKVSLKKDGGAENISEDMRKLAHVAKMIGLNQSVQEKKIGLMRLSVWMERHDRAVESDEVVVLQCLDIGKPCVDSRQKKKLGRYYEKLKEDNKKKSK